MIGILFAGGWVSRRLTRLSSISGCGCLVAGIGVPGLLNTAPYGHGSERAYEPGPKGALYLISQPDTGLVGLVAILRTEQFAGLTGQRFDLHNHRLEIDRKRKEIVQKQSGFNSPNQQNK